MLCSPKQDFVRKRFLETQGWQSHRCSGSCKGRENRRDLKKKSMAQDTSINN